MFFCIFFIVIVFFLSNIIKLLLLLVVRPKSQLRTYNYRNNSQKQTNQNIFSQSFTSNQSWMYRVFNNIFPADVFFPEPLTEETNYLILSRTKLCSVSVKLLSFSQRGLDSSGCFTAAFYFQPLIVLRVGVARPERHRSVRSVRCPSHQSDD